MGILIKEISRRHNEEASVRMYAVWADGRKVVEFPSIQECKDWIQANPNYNALNSIENLALALENFEGGSSAGERMEVFDSTETYTAADFVSYQNRIYKANVATTGAFDVADWTLQSDIDKQLEVFDTAKSYLINSFVSFSDKIYKANVAVSAGAFNVARWTLQNKADDLLILANHDTALDYQDGNFVSANNKIYRANGWVPAGAFNAADWTLQNSPTTILTLAEHSTAVNYVAGDFVSFNNRIYKALLANNGTFSATNWILQSDVDKTITVYDSTKGYEEDRFVSFNNRIYKANTYAASGGFDATEWTLQGSVGGDSIALFDTANSYLINSFVSFSDSIYRANSAITAGAFDSSDWTVQGEAALDDWTDAIMTNGYTSHATIKVQYKSVRELTYIRGLAINGAGHTDGAHTIFDLPAAYSPAIRNGFTVIHNNHLTTCRVDVLDNGNVQQVGNMADYAYVNFSFVHV